MDAEGQRDQNQERRTMDVLPPDAPAQNPGSSPTNSAYSNTDYGESGTNDDAPQKSPENYDRFMPQLKPKKTWPRVIGWTLFILIVLGALAGGGWWFMKHNPNSKKTQTSQQPKSQNNANANVKSYTSGDLNLSLNYPEKWTVTETNGKLTVVSTPMQITGADGHKQTGQVKLTIQNANAADFSMFKNGGAVAVLASQRISYSNPAANQRGTTYISFLQSADTNTRGQLDAIFLTGDLGYQYDQTIPESDIVKIDPDTRVTFLKCSDQNCQTAAPMGISATSWNDTKFSAPILALIKSLQIQ